MKMYPNVLSVKFDDGGGTEYIMARAVDLRNGQDVIRLSERKWNATRFTFVADYGRGKLDVTARIIYARVNGRPATSDQDISPILNLLHMLAAGETLAA